MATTEIKEIAESRGFNRWSLAQAAQVSSGVIERLFDGRIPANHPFLPRIAKTLKVSLDTVQLKAGCQSVRPMAPHQVERLVTRWGGEEPSPRARKVAVAVVKHRNGGVAHKRSYNKLRRLDDAARQVARSLVMTTNVAAMAGQDTLTLEDVPTAALGRVLERYLELEGVPDGAVLKVDFADVFG